MGTSATRLKTSLKRDAATLPTTRQFFSRVAIARQVLREKAEEIYAEYFETLKLAKEAGDFETASKGLQWLMDHMPAEDDGTRMIDVSVDKTTTVVAAPTGPSIQIGIQLGGVKPQKALPSAEVIDVKPIK